MNGITFCDIDNSLFFTFAKIIVRDKVTNKEIIKLDNQQFNSYQLKDDEYFDFHQFKDAKFFRKTSIPIQRTVDRVNKMISQIKKNKLNSKVIFLTARVDFDDKNELLKKFKEHGIDTDFRSNVYIERSGNENTGVIEKNKEIVIMRYLKDGIYRRVRMIDDYKPNLSTFLSIAKKMPDNIINSIRETANIPENSDEPVMEFYALYIDDKGKLSLYGKEEVR